MLNLYKITKRMGKTKKILVQKKKDNKLKKDG